MQDGDGAESAGVVVAGAINTDLVAVVHRAPDGGETVTGRSFSVFGGGKGANQAVAARRSGAAVALVGALGADDFGVQRRVELERDGVDIGSVATRQDASSGVAVIIVEDGGENRIAYIPGATLSVSPAELVEALDRTRPVVYLQPNEVPAVTARAGLVRAGEIGALRILNAAPDPGNVKPLLDEVDVLVVNEGEARALVGSGDELQGDPRALTRLLASELDVSVVVTAGAAGAFAMHEGAAMHVSAPEVKVVDTTGAGDAFCGALAASLGRNQTFEDALRWAVAAGGLATTVAGAQPSIPIEDAVRALVARMG